MADPNTMPAGFCLTTPARKWQALVCAFALLRGVYEKL
jgi:hypothetical protein